jgi:hypothetical protein
LYDPNDLEKHKQIISAFEWNGLRMMQFQRTEQSDVDQALLKWF